MKVFREYLFTIVLAVVLASVLRAYLVESYRVPGIVMSPTLDHGDTILVWKFRPQPTRGDVIVYANVEEGGVEYVRRVVGLPGDHVEVRGGNLILNGEKVALKAHENEPQVANCQAEKLGNRIYQVCGSDQLSIPAFQVPENHFFVLADGRQNDPGKETSVFQTIPLDAVRGKVITIWFSWASSRIRFDRMFRSV